MPAPSLFNDNSSDKKKTLPSFYYDTPWLSSDDKDAFYNLCSEINQQTESRALKKKMIEFRIFIEKHALPNIPIEFKYSTKCYEDHILQITELNNYAKDIEKARDIKELYATIACVLVFYTLLLIPLLIPIPAAIFCGTVIAGLLLCYGLTKIIDSVSKELIKLDRTTVANNQELIDRKAQDFALSSNGIDSISNSSLQTDASTQSLIDQSIFKSSPSSSSGFFSSATILESMPEVDTQFSLAVSNKIPCNTLINASMVNSLYNLEMKEDSSTDIPMMPKGSDETFSLTINP